jgi:ribosomal protein L39E
MIPPPGVDVVVAFAYQRTEAPVGDKVAANWVNERDELNLVTPVESVETVIAAGASAGGTAPESTDRVLQFAPAKLRHRDRAVSLRDFEQLVLQKSEEVVQARAFRRNGRVRLIVVTKGTSISPSRAQQREWRRALLEVAPPSLGVRDGLTIGGPRVRRLAIALTLRVRNLDLGGKVAEQAKDRLINCFDPGAGWSLGRTARDEDIAEALLDIPDLDGIVSIGLFEVDELGTERPWRAPVAPNELITLAPENVRVGFDVMEAAA